MQIGVKVAPVKKFNSKLIFKRWLKSGKRHIRGHKTKHKPNLKKLETTEKNFFHWPNNKVVDIKKKLKYLAKHTVMYLKYTV